MLTVWLRYIAAFDAVQLLVVLRVFKRPMVRRNLTYPVTEIAVKAA